MITRRTIVIAICAVALGVPIRAGAQQKGKLWRVGYLEYGTRQFAQASGRYPAFIDGMRALGYVEGKDFVVEARYADGKAERLAPLAQELVKSSVDVIVSTGTPATQAAQRATPTVPIVAAVVTDPVVERFASSLSRPGKNITGLTNSSTDIAQKQLELLLKALPRMKRVAVLSNPVNEGRTKLLELIGEAARRAGVAVISAAASTPEEIERAFGAMTRERAEAVIILGDSFLAQQGRQIAGLARERRLASIFTNPDHAEAGGLMGYGADIRDLHRRAATFVDKILKGAKPGDLPFEQPTVFHLVINRGTAKAIGLELPQELLLRADRVIE